MTYKKAERPAGAPTAIDKDSTAADFEEALGHLVEAARRANERHNVILYDIMHRRIDEKLECWQVLHALEASQNVP